MPMILFEESGVFNPADYDIKIGDRIHVICVGGGQACNSVIATSTTKDGKTTSFGSHLSASGATDTVYTSKPPNSITIPYYTILSDDVRQVTDTLYNIGGAGGFDLSSPIIGGTARVQSTKYEDFNSIYTGSTSIDLVPEHKFRTKIIIEGLSGRISLPSYYYGLTIEESEYSNSNMTGSRGSNSNNATVFPGNGYGAGGVYYRSSNDIGAGASGVISEKEVILTSLDSIAITIGDGGYYGVVKGADGCCVIFY